VLHALRELDIPVHVVAGTSMGALVGALYARQPDPARVWTELRAYVEDREFADYWAAFSPRRDGDEREDARPWHGLFDFMQRGRIAVRTMATRSAEHRERLEAPLARLLGRTRTFADLTLPFAAVALDLVSGRMVVYREGDLLEALYASCAIPGVFPPIEKQGKLIVDGGGPYRVPVEAVRDMGARFVVAVDIPGYLEPRLRTGFDLGMRSNSIARDRLNELVCATADALIRPPVELFHWADFRSGEAIRDLGYQAARAALPEIERSWQRRRSPLRRVAELVRLGPRRSA
jgi:NTE family protein